MPWNNTPDSSLIGIIGALIISMISGFISISRRIILGQIATPLWIISEFLTAILCGYLVYDSWAGLSPYMAGWVSQPIAVAIAAHTGGRVFQELESVFITKYTNFLTNNTKK